MRSRGISSAPYRAAMARIGKAIERKLVQQYTKEFDCGGSTKAEARQLAKDMVRRIVRRSKANRSYGHALDAGDRFLEMAEVDPILGEGLRAMRAEFVTDDDIRSWWNQHDLLRQVALQDDEMIRLVMMETSMAKGMSEAEAGARCDRLLPSYRSIDVDDVGDDVHRPLPIALKNRVDRWIATRKTRPGETVFEKPAARSGSANAHIRYLLRKGKLRA